MRTILFALMLVVVAAVSVRADEPLSIEAIAAIAKIRAKTPRPATPPATKPEDKPKASGKVQWESYKAARDSFMTLGDPLVVVFGMENCGPCRSLKAAIEKERISGVNYAYVDVVDEPEVAAKVGIAPPKTVPQVVIRYERDRKMWLQHLGEGHATAANVSKAIHNALGTEAKAAPSVKAAYSYRVERIALPRGMQWHLVDEATPYIVHVTRDHGEAIKEVTSRVALNGMSDRDLMGLHTLLHYGASVGRWEGSTFVFMLP